MHLVLESCAVVTVMDLDIVWLNGRYRLESRVGTGLFGESNAVMLCPLPMTHKYAGDIYLACDILSGQHVILKLELLNNNHQTLEHKFHVYHKLQGGMGIPQVYWFGTECGFNTLAMNLLGHSLEDLVTQCHF
jgi:hypothetical protein